jgi:hypothetical protein
MIDALKTGFSYRCCEGRARGVAPSFRGALGNQFCGLIPETEVIERK